MPTIYGQNFESSTSPPAGWNFDAGIAVDTTSALSGANSLLVNTTGAKSAIYATQDGRSGNVTVSTRFKFASPGASSAVHLVARLSDPTPANYLTSASSYRAQVTCGSAAANWMIYRQAGGTSTAIFTGTSTFATSIVAGTAYEAYLTANGGATPGTRLSLEIRRVSDGLWLNSSAAWVATRTPVANVMDTTPLAGQGYSGVRAELASGASLYLDEFNLVDFLDPSTYTKTWVDDSGWTVGVGTATAGVFGSERGLVITGNSTLQQVTAATNDRQWGNTCTYNTQFKFSSAYNAVNAGFRLRNYLFRFNTSTSLIELVDTAGAVVASIPYTFANWVAGRAYRMLAVGTDAAIQFAVQDTSTSSYLQPGGTFAAGFTWAFNQALSTPSWPGGVLNFYCNLSTGATMSVGTFTAGPAGTPSASPNPATVVTGSTTPIAASQFDGVSVTGTVTSGGGSYSGGSYTAPAAAGSATLRLASQYRPAQTVDVPITIKTIPASSYTLTGPSSGYVGSASSNFTVAPNGIYTGTITVTPSGGGLSTPIALTFSNSIAPQTFSINPTSAGIVTLTPTNSGSITNPSAPTYAASNLLTTAYVAANGSDSNAGSSATSPLLTVAAAIAATSAGATINLRGGDTFATTIALNPTTGARVIQSYGTGQAVVQSAGYAIAVTDLDGVTLSNVKFLCTSSTSGIAVSFTNTDGVRRTGGVTIANCDISGGLIPLRFLGATGTTGGWNGVSITGNTVYNGVFMGIYLADSANAGANKHFSNVTIQGNTVRDISGAQGTGSGIVIATADTTTGTNAGPCVIKNNHIYNCGAKCSSVAGPGGTFPLFSDGVLTSGNVIHDIFSSSAGTDGCGLDADLETSNCVFERNYVYNCDGAGFLMFSAGGGHVVRWNVFANCGRSSYAGMGGIRLDGSGSCTFHNNTVYSLSPTNAALFGTSGSTVGKKLYNNTFVSAPGVATFDLPTLDATFQMEGNAYQGANNTFLGKVAGTTYNSMATFLAATGKENNRGFVSSNPFAGYGSAIPTPTDPAAIASMTFFSVPAGSPLAGAGLDLKSLYGMNPGTLDYVGSTVAVPYSVGAVTAAAAPANATGYTLAASPASVIVGSPTTVTATLAGGTALSSTLVITLADSLDSTISGSISIANGSTTGTATVNPSASGTHAITATHTGGGFTGGDGSTSFAAAANPIPLATTYALDFGSDAPVAGQRYRIAARLPAGTRLASDVTVTLAGSNIQYSSTQGGTPASTGSLTIAAATGSGSAYFVPTAAGPVAPSATNGSGLTNPTIASFVATAAPSSLATGYGLYFPPAVAGIATQAIAYLTGGTPLASNLVITPTAAGVTLPATITITAGQSSVTFPFTVAQAGTSTVTATHSGLPTIADPGPSTITTSSAGGSSGGGSGLGGLQPSRASFSNLNKGGLTGVLNAVVMANPTLSPAAVAQIPGPTGGSLDKAYRGLVQLVDSYLHGDPIPQSDVNTRFADYVSIFTSVAQAASEVAALVQSSPGSLRTTTSTSGINTVTTRTFT